MISFDELRKHWDAGTTKQAGYVRIVPDHPLDIHVGLDKSGRRSFSLVVGKKKLDIEGSSLVDIHPVLAGDGNYAEVFSLISNGYEELFLKLFWDLIDFTYHDTSPLYSWIARYKQWQKLLSPAGNNYLSRNQEKGLLGELLYLRELLNDGNQEAVQGWQGSMRADQDFVFSTGWAEVKTVNSASESIKISSLQQLDREDIGNLVVYFLDRVENGNNPLNLVSVINDIKNYLSQKDIQEENRFESKLALAGYNDSDADYYRDHYFYLQGKNIYSVDKVNFPKLTVNNLPYSRAVTNCTYSLALAAIEGFKIG